MSSLLSHPGTLFVAFLVGLIIVIEIGIRVRLASSDIDEGRQSLAQSARDGLTVLLSFLLGFALPMALPYYEQRANLVIDEANAIATVDQRAQLLPEPFEGKIRLLLREYVDARIEFGYEPNDQSVRASAERANHLQNEMWQENVAWARQYPNLVIAPMIAQSLGSLSDLSEQRLAAYERRIPGAIWFVLTLISVLTCFVIGYSMRRRSLLAMIVMPLTVAIVLSLVSELDSPRTGFIRASQQSMERLRLELKTEITPNQ